MGAATKATTNRIRQQLHDQLRERFGAEDTYVWVDDFDPDQGWVVYEVSPDDAASTTWRLGYAMDGEDASLDTGEPTEVERVVDYAPKSAQLTGPFVRKDQARRIGYSAVLVPGEPDSDDEVLTAAKVEEVAHTWLEQFRAFDMQHSVKQIEAVPVESYIEPADRVVEIDGDEVTLPAGTWTVAVKFHDEDAWGEVVAGKRNGLSIMGVPSDQLEAALAAVKSGGQPALKRVTLADVGGGDANGEWFAPFIGVVDEPAVPKAKFHAFKSAERPGLARRLRDALGGGATAAAKEGRKFSDKTYGQLQAAAEAVSALLAEAETERTTRAAKAHDEEIDDMDRTEIQEAVSESVTGAVKSALDDALAEALKPINDRLDKVDPPADPADNAAEAVKAALAEAGADADPEQVAAAVKAALTPRGEPTSEGIEAAIKAAIEPLVDRVDRVEKRTRPGSLQPDDGGDLEPAIKTVDRDAFGRSVTA